MYSLKISNPANSAILKNSSSLSAFLQKANRMHVKIKTESNKKQSNVPQIEYN
jgi:hypothetical protein